MPDIFIHPTADVSPDAEIGAKTKVWAYAQIRERTSIGNECVISKNVYVDFDVRIGNRCKVQNNCSLYHGLTVEDGVFIGPHVVFANDKVPRAITKDGELKSTADWKVSPTTVRYGASIGAHSVILPGVTIGRFAMIGSGSVVTKDVPDFALVYGNPARVHGYVDEEGNKVEKHP